MHWTVEEPRGSGGVFGRRRGSGPRADHGPSTVRFREAVEHRAQLPGADIGAERPGARFEPYSFGEGACRDGVEADSVDKARDGGEVVRVVTGDRDRLASRRPRTLGPVLEVVV